MKSRRYAGREMARPPPEVPREHAEDGRRHDERHQDEAEVGPRVGAVAEGRAEADGAGGGIPRNAQDQEGAGQRAARPCRRAHSRYTVTYRIGQRPTTKCQNIAHACTGAMRPSPKRPRATSAVVISSQTRAASTCRPCSPMSAKKVVP